MKSNSEKEILKFWMPIYIIVVLGIYTLVYFKGMNDFGSNLLNVSSCALIFLWIFPFFVFIIILIPGYIEIIDEKMILKKNLIEPKIVIGFNKIEKIVLYASRINEIVTKDNKKIEINKYLDKRDEFLTELGDGVKVVHYPIYERKLDRK